MWFKIGSVGTGIGHISVNICIFLLILKKIQIKKILLYFIFRKILFLNTLLLGQMEKTL